MRPLRCILGVGKGNGTLRSLKGFYVDWGDKMEPNLFFTNTVLIIDNVSCLEQVFSLLSLRTKTAKCCA